MALIQKRTPQVVLTKLKDLPMELKMMAAKASEPDEEVQTEVAVTPDSATPTATAATPAAVPSVPAVKTPTKTPALASPAKTPVLAAPIKTPVPVKSPPAAAPVKSAAAPAKTPVTSAKPALPNSKPLKQTTLKLVKKSDGPKEGKLTAETKKLDGIKTPHRPKILKTDPQSQSKLIRYEIFFAFVAFIQFNRIL